ncbi:hypothetical protein C2E19_23015 [Pseudomonas sp. DTU12.3]|nr:hypothetical protein C2E19_23015 [Pseudomonas sp. DTU12.3]
MVNGSVGFPVGGGLLPKAVGQSASLLNDTPLSRARPLPPLEAVPSVGAVSVRYPPTPTPESP